MADSTCKKKRRKARMIRDPRTGMMMNPPPRKRPHRNRQRRDERWLLNPVMRSLRLAATKAGA